MRPKSIVRFEIFYLAALALAVVNAVTSWSRNAALIHRSGADTMVAGYQYWTTGLGLLIPLLLWYFVARRASVIAKWIIVAMFAIGALSLGYVVIAGRLANGLGGVLAAVAFVFQAVAVAMLFRADARTWLGEDVMGEIVE